MKAVKRLGLESSRVANLENTSEYMIAHDADQCAGVLCCLHNRSDHPMRKFPQHFRMDRGIMERICPHGVGHPDPDQEDYFTKTFGSDAKWQWVHGCDGCCDPDGILYKANYGFHATEV